MNEKVEEYYEKCRAVLSVVDSWPIAPDDADALIWIARDYLKLLGDVIGITPTK